MTVSESEKSIFLAALDLPAAEREMFLAQACGGNSQLLADVQQLLRAHDLSDNPLDQLPFGVRPADGSAPRCIDPGITGDYLPKMDGPGTAIRGYKLIEQIGEGGFGLVFVAEQQAPVRRKVALKIIKPGMDTRDIIARFEAERQALAMMDHPNIAHVLDAGATEAGRPFFVMELVRGIPINEFCDQQRLTPRQRIELFISVCQAVQHAHQKGIIHRDLKPSNILITLHDGRPVAKIIDFGVAKAIGQLLTEKTIYTRFAQMIGTPLYMSPEQAEMSGLDVDTRSDIYSLGVLLYELLVGITPADPKRLQSAGFDEVRRIIREDEPVRPSMRLTTLAKANTTITANRQIEPRKLSTFVLGDLDWIVMKALEKDRRRRYQTAGDFAADLRRFLNELPVEARPVSQLYRLQKFARRHKVAITSVTLVLSALLLGTVVSTWQAMRATQAEARAIKERDQKVLALAEAEQLRAQAESQATHLKQVNLILARARAHAESELFAAANNEYSEAVRLMPNLYYSWMERGAFYVRLGLWDLAANDYAKACELGALSINQSLCGVPQLFLYAGDRDRYGDACRQMFDMMRESDNWRSATTVLRCSVVGPLPLPQAKALADIAEDCLNDGQPMAVQLYTLALAHYRAQHYDQALDYLADLQTTDPHWPGHVILAPLVAMTQYRLQHHDEARQALRTADLTLDNWTESMLQDPGSSRAPWFDWVEFVLLYREAKSLIGGSSSTLNSRLDSIHEHGMAMIQNVDISAEQDSN